MRKNKANNQSGNDIDHDEHHKIINCKIWELFILFDSKRVIGSNAKKTITREIFNKNDNK